MLLVVNACVVFTARNFIVKSEALNNLDVLLIQSSLMTLVLAFLAKAKGHQLWPSDKVANLARIRIGLLMGGMAGIDIC